MNMKRTAIEALGVVVVPLLYVAVVLFFVVWGCWLLITGGWRLIKRVCVGRRGRRAVALRFMFSAPRTRPGASSWHH